MVHVNCKFLHLAFKIFSSAIIFIFSLERSENSQLQIPNQQRTVQQKNNSGERHNSDTRKASRQTLFHLRWMLRRFRCVQIFLKYDINVQQEREKKRQAVVFVSSFHPRGGVFCSSWRDGAVCLFFRGGTEWLLFFSEAGRGGFFFFPRRDGVAFFFFFDGTGRGGVFFFFSRAGTGRLFLAVAIFLAGRGKIFTPSRQRRFKPSRQPSM